MINSHRDLVKGIKPKTKRTTRRRIAKEIHGLGKAASYARFSSALQNETSNSDQHRENEKAAKKNGHTIGMDHRYSDQEISGTRSDREGLNELLKAARAGKFSTIYFFSLSRLARQSLIGMSILKNLVTVYGVRIISVSESIDTERHGWEMAAEVLLLFHEKYIQQLAADVLRGQEGCVLAGNCVGDHRLGYKSVVIENAQAEAAAKILRRNTLSMRRKQNGSVPSSSGMRKKGSRSQRS